MSLRGLADAAGCEIGVCATAEYLTDEWYADLLAKEFNRVALENDLIWENVHPQRDSFEFGPADTLIDFATRHDMSVTGHALVWHIELPDWVVDTDWSPNELADELRSHIETVTARYAGQVDAWDVVNEAVNDAGEYRDTVWFDQLGEEYIADAFRWAAAHTSADLLYNDYGLPVNDAKREQVYELLSDLLDQGVPIDGIGLQLHCVGMHPTPEQITQTIHQFQELDIDVRVTEWDVAYRRENRPDDLDAVQAQYYREMLQAILDAGVETITFWGLTDAHSWITSWREYPDHYTQRPLLFDATGEKKASYEAVASVLRDYTHK